MDPPNKNQPENDMMNKEFIQLDSLVSSKKFNRIDIIIPIFRYLIPNLCYFFFTESGFFRKYQKI